ncbi:MAG: tetratricopeptide repeat protein [Candidatus Obscuribacterales bacterium]|nr:tetratricopeptide repeat protein [Candidatus Obscuribacterales bacterium]
MRKVQYFSADKRAHFAGLSYLLAASICLGGFAVPSYAASDRVVQLNNDGVNGLKANNYPLAVSKFLECLKLDPSYKLAKENMAICYNNWGISLQNNPAQAIEKFHKSLFYSPDNPTAVQNLEVTIQNLGKDPKSFKDRVALGKQARLAGDLEGGIVEFAEALKIKDDPALRVELGNAYYVRDRVDDAITQYNIATRSASLDPDTKAKVYRSLGQAYQAKKDYPHSVEAYNIAITLNRTDRETLEANKAVWTDAVQKDPLNAANHVGLGQAYMYIGDFDQAQAELRQALVFDKNNQPAQTLLSKIPLAKREYERDKHINNGVDLQSRKLYDAAIQEYSAALGLDAALPPPEQDAANIMLNIASANQAKENYAEAISWYGKALQRNPQLPGAQDGMKVCQDRLAAKQLDDAATEGANLFKSGRFDEALKRYQMILSANPKDPAAHFNVAATLQALKQIDAAVAEFKKACDLAPDNKQYKDYLTKAIQDKADPIIDLAVKKHADKDYTSAIDLYLKALAIVPDNTKVLFNLAGAYYSRQQFPEAQKIYEQLYQKDPKGQVDDLWLIGTILENAKRGNDALATYSKYLSEAPRGTYFAQAKDRIDALRKDPTDCMKIKSETEIAQDKAADDAYKAAVKAQQEKRWDDANNAYLQAFSIRPKDPATPFGLGTMFQQKGDIDSALKWFQTAVDLGAADPKFDKKTLDEFKQAIKLAKEEKAKPFVEDAVKRQSAGDQLAAIDLYRKALDFVPNNARIWTNLGQAYQLTDDFAKARDCYQKAVDLNAKDESTNWYLIGKIDENFGQGNDAVAHYRKYLLAAPTGQYANDANSRLAVLTKDITKTQKLPTQGEIKTAKIADDEYNQGLSTQKSGNPAEALSHYQKAAAAKPDESAYVEAIATCYQQMKDYDNALSAYDQAIAIASRNNHPKDVEIYNTQRQQCAEEKAGPIVDKALAAYQSGDYTSAADLYGQVIQIVPKIAKMHTSRAAALQGADNFQAALDEYQKGYDLDPKGERENLYLIAALQENFGKGPIALNTYRKYLTENPSGQYAQLARTRAAELSKDVSKTVKIPTSGERKNQEQVSGLYNDAVAAYNKGDYDTCVSKMQAVLGLANDPVYHYQLGAAYLGLKNYDNARAEFITASKLDPANKTYRDLPATVLQQQLAPIVDDAVKKQTAGDLPGAIAGYRQALQLDPNNANVHTNLASALQASEDFATARAEFEKGLALDRKAQIGNLYFMAILDENFSKGTQALQEYKQYAAEAGASGAYTGLAQARIKALTANPNDLQKMVTQADVQKTQATNQAYQDGFAAQQAGNFDLAIQKYTEAIGGNAAEPAYYFALGTAFDNKGDLDNAIKNYEKAIQMNSKEKTWKDTLKSARQRKAEPFIKEAYDKQTTKDDKGNYDLAGAILAYENALKADDDPATRLNCGTAYQGNNNLPKALEMYKKAVSMDPNLVDGYYYMGTVYEGMKQPALAIAEYRKYLAKQPAGPNAAACKDRLKALGAK